MNLPWGYQIGHSTRLYYFQLNRDCPTETEHCLRKCNYDWISSRISIVLLNRNWKGARSVFFSFSLTFTYQVDENEIKWLAVANRSMSTIILIPYQNRIHRNLRASPFVVGESEKNEQKNRNIWDKQSWINKSTKNISHGFDSLDL